MCLNPLGLQIETARLFAQDSKPQKWAATVRTSLQLPSKIAAASFDVKMFGKLNSTTDPLGEETRTGSESAHLKVTSIYQ